MKQFSLKSLLQRWSHEPPLGWAQLSHQKVRLLVALSGIAFADILIFMQLGFKNLLYDGATLVHRNLQGDIALISNRADFLGNGQTFSRRYLYQAAAVEGVASASPLYYSWAYWVNPWNQEVTEVAVIAFDPVRPILDLPEVNQQLDTIKLSNIVLFDRQSQPTTGPVTEAFTQGETITTEVSGHRVKVGGIFTLGSSFFLKGHLLTSDWNYIRLFGSDSLEGVTTGVLTLEAGADPQQVLARLHARLPEEVQAMTREDYVDYEIAFWSSEHPAGTIFNFGAVMGFVVGVVVVNQVLYSDVNDHLAEYATLKAMGYSDRRLLLVVFQEGILLALLGFLPGFGVSVGMYGLLSSLTRIPVMMKLGVAVQVFMATLIMCLLSAGIAMRKLQAADPADVF